MDKKLTEKLKDVLSTEDLKELEDGIKAMVSEQVTLLSEEKINELEAKAEEFCEKEISEKVAEEKEVLIEEYEKKMTDLENNMVEKLDTFLDSVITEQISDEALTKIAINETFEPIIEGIKQLFEEKYVALDTDGEKLVKEAKKEIESLKEENSNLIKEKMELAELAEKGAIKLLIAEKTDGLTETQKERVNTFCEGKDFDELESKIDSFIELVEEKEEDTNKEISEDVDPNNSDKEIVNEEDIKKETKESVKETIIEDSEYEGTVGSAEKFL